MGLRYHVGGLEGVYHESPPFRSPNLAEQEGNIEIVTRFIGLARVGNPKKEKWMYALSLTPLDKMKITDLLQKTTDEIPCPFDFGELNSKSKFETNPDSWKKLTLRVLQFSKQKGKR